MKIFHNDFKYMLSEIFLDGRTTMAVAWLMLLIGLMFGWALHK